MFYTSVPQLLVLSWRAVEPLRGWASLAKVAWWGQALKVLTLCFFTCHDVIRPSLLLTQP